MSLRNGILPSPTMAVWSFAAVLLLAAGSLPLQAQEYTPLPGLRVSDGLIQYGFFSAGGCINLSNTTINGVVYTVHTSKWQRRAGSTWVDVPGTEHNGGVCAYSTTNPGEYRLVAEVSIGGQRGFYSSENTFTIEGMAPPPVTGGPTYYFPHLAVGDKYQTTITYINYSSEEVTCQTDFLSDQGTPLMVSFADKGTVMSRIDVLDPGGSVHQETNAELSAPLAPGWARATCTGPVKASLLFRLHDSAGMPVAEAGVNAATVPATRFVTFAEQGEGQPGTGVAYANPSDTEAVITFTARDSDGEMLASVDKPLLPNGHGAQNMAPLFGLSSFTGSLEVTSTAPIVSLSINAEAAPVFSSLPPGELDAAAQGSTTYYFPHLAVGDKYQTTITYINYSPQEVTCQTDFISDHGSPLLVSFADRGMGVDRTDVLPPGGSVHQETNVELSALLAPGWARATCTGPVKASLLFRLHDSAGMPVAEAGVNAATVPATRFVTFAEQGEGQPGTGVAYANPSDTSALVTFTARAADGEMLASVDKPLLPNGHGAQNMAPLFGLSSFTGSLEVTSTAPIVSLSINAEAAPVFSSLPSGELDVAPDVPGEMLAPANEAAFNDLFVGKRAATNDPELYVEFVSPGRFRDDDAAGNYTYRNTGSNTGTVTLNYGEGDRCTLSLTFVSTTAGTGTFTCTDGDSGEYNWRLVVIPMTGAPDLVVQTPSVSNSSPNAGESFTLSATVRNQGNGQSASTTLRYYRSSDETISTGDTEVGTGAVSGLSAFGISDESISLTAPSTAGTYYYGACVDPVSGESATGNNCSSAVSVTVSASQMETEYFDLGVGNDDPDGITFANDRIFVVDGRDDEVYAYQASGQRDSASDFDLAISNSSATGITFANDKFYVIDWLDDKVYAYQASGQRDSASDFDLDSDNGNPHGITFANDKFYVTDEIDDKVYAYRASGQRDSASDFELDSDNGSPLGITFANERFYVVDAGALDWVYAYQASGQRDSASDFHLDSAITYSPGITFANGRFYVVYDRTLNSVSRDRIYVVESPQQSPDLALWSFGVRDNPESGTYFSSGITVVTEDSFGARATVRNRGTRAAAATTLRYYRSSDRTISTSDTQVGTDAVSTLSSAGTSTAETALTAPPTAGTYYYGACIDSVSGESDTQNNCSTGVRVTVREPLPDLVVESPSVSDTTPDSQGSFVFSATVRNRGTLASGATTLRYYRSDDRTISTSDTQVGTGAVGALPAAGTSSETITLPAPSTEGTYYYGACVDSVSGESDTQNNCSSAVVVFGGGPFPAYDLAISSINLDAPSFAIIGSSSIKLTVSVTNSGPNASRPAKLRFSGGRSFDLDIPVLEPDGTMTYESQTVGTARLGTTTYRACIAEAPGEENTDNNCRSRSVTYLLN